MAAERLVEAMIQRDGLPAVIVNPSTPIGPRDVRPTPTGRIIVEAASGRMPAFVDTGLNLVHVDDVAAGHVAALERGRIGERYILGGENVLLADMLADIAGLSGGGRRRSSLPRSLLYPIAYGAELLATLRGVEPFVTLDGLRMARHHMFFDDAKARRELGYASRPYGEGLADAIAWFRAHGASQMISAALALLFRSRSGPIFCLAGDGSGCAASGTTAARRQRGSERRRARRLAQRRGDRPGSRRGRHDRSSVGSLPQAGLPGPFSVVVVDDQSADGTAAAASAAATTPARLSG